MAMSTVTNLIEHGVPFGWGSFLGSPLWAGDAISAVMKREELLCDQIGVVNSISYQPAHFFSVYSQRIPINISHAFLERSVAVVIADIVSSSVPISMATFRSGVKRLSESNPTWFAPSRDFEVVVLDSIEMGHTISEMRRVYQVEEKTIIGEEIELAVADRYKDVKEVGAIYIQKYKKELQVTVLLKISQYKDELMDKLLDLEYELQEKYTEPLLALSYIPGDFKDIRSVVHPKAKLIFER